MTGGINVSSSTFTGVASNNLALVNLVVNGGTGLNGTVTFPTECDMVWNINAIDGTVLQGTIVQCDTDNFPQSSSSLAITATVSEVGILQFTFTFNGTTNAAASVTLNGGAYATCSVNIFTYDATCDGA